MQEIFFITGNQKKADYLAQYLGFSISHMKVELDELQSLDLKKIVEHKVRQAYAKIGKPVIVEDVALEFEGLHGLPGPFIRFFIDNIPRQEICSLVDGKSRKATARCVYGYFDGKELKLFESYLDGEIAREPGIDKGFGWDNIFIPNGYQVTRSALEGEDDRKTYLQIKPLNSLREFLVSLT